MIFTRGHMEYIPTFSSISLQTTIQSSRIRHAFEHIVCPCVLAAAACLPAVSAPAAAGGASLWFVRADAVLLSSSQPPRVWSFRK